MNKIYKVIWSKAKHTYVVASEIAKGHTKGETTGRGLKKLAAAMLVAAALLSPNFAWAEGTVTVTDPTTSKTVEVYTKEGAEKEISILSTQIGTNATNIDTNTKNINGLTTRVNALESSKTDTALHISSSGDLIVGTKENQTVKDMEIRGELTSGSISTGDITSSRDVTVTGKMAAGGVTDETTKDGTYIKQNNTVGNNLVSLDKQVKANADAINTEATARESKDNELNDRITNVKEYLEKQTSDNYVSKADAAVQDAGVVKADKKIGENVTALGKGLYDETAARIGADKAQDAVIQQVNQNAANGIATLATAYNNEVASREAADTAINNKLAQDKTDTALHVTKDGNLIVGTKENQTVKDVKIRGQLTSGSVSTGNITATGDAKVAGKVEAEAVYDDTTKPGNYVVQTNSVGSNLSVLDTQVKANADTVATKANAADVYTKTETDSKVDAVKKEATTYTYRKVAAEEAARKAADNELNERITNEANAIHETTNQLQSDLSEEAKTRESKDNELNERITNEANAIHDEIKAGDTALDNRITAVKESLQQEAADTYVSKADAAVQDGAIVKADKTIGENVTNLDAALAKETADRLGADKAQDKVIQQVNQNMVDGFNTINKNMADGFTALNAADAAEKEARIGADKKLAEAVNSGLSLRDDNVLQKNTTTVADDGTVTTSKSDANEMILNKGNKNQITLNEKGVKVGTNSSVMDADGIYTGGDTFDAAKAAMSSDGQIKGANGKFTVDASGNTTVTSLDAGTGTIQTKGDIYAKDATFSGDITAKDATLSGDLGAKDGTFSGDLSAKDGTFSGDVSAKDVTATGTLQGAEVTDGTATMKNGNITGVKDLSAETITTSGDATIGGDLTVKGKLNVDEIDLTKSGIVGDNNVTASTKVAAGEITGYKKATSTKDGSEKESAIDYDENGTSTWAIATDAHKQWNKSTLTVEGSDVKSEVVDSKENSNLATQTSTQSQSTLTDKDNNTNVSTQTASESSSVVSGKDGGNNYKSYITQNLKKILQKIEDGDGHVLTSTEQTETDITNTAKNGTITNDAGKLVNTASDTIANMAGNDITNTSTNGNIANTAANGTISNNAKNLTNTASENITNKAENGNISNIASNGTISNEAKTISNKADEALTNDAKTITNTASESVTTQIGDGSEVQSVMNGGGIANKATGKSITNDAATITNTGTTSVTNQVGNNKVLVDTTHVQSAFGDTIYTTWDESGITNNATDKTVATNAKNIQNTATGDITNTAEKGTITNKAQNLVNDASGNMTNTVGGNLIDTIMGTSTTTVTGKVTEDYKSDLSTKVGGDETHAVTGNQTTTVSGNRTVNVKGTETENFNALETNVKTDQKTSVGGNQTTIVTGNQTNNVSGSKTETVKGSVTEKYGSQATTVNGDQSTNIGGNQTTVVAKDQTNTVSGNKTETVKGAVNETYGSQTTKVNGDQSTTVTGKQTNSITGDQVNTIGGNQTTTVTGDSSLSAKNITNTASEKITNQIGDGSAVKSEMTADGITNTAEGGTIYNKSKDILNEVSGDILNFADGEIGNSATKITNLTGDNTVTSDTNGTTFENKAHSTAIEEGSVTKTTISGNTLETGKATMDYAEVMKDLGVRGNAAVDGNTTLGKEGAETTLTVNSTSTFNKDVTMKGNAVVENNLEVKGSTKLDGTLEVVGKSTFKDDVTMEKNLGVTGTTTTDKLVVNNGATVTGGTTTDTLKVTGSSEFDGKATFNDIVTMNKGLSVTGGVTADTVTADSYKVGDKTYIDKDGINANNQVIRNVGQGNISEGSTDAVSGGQLYETNTRVTGLETRMGTVETRVDKLDNKIDKVGANAAAMANLHPLEFDEDSKWNIAAAVGSSGSETASAVGVFYRPNENVMVNASAAMGTGENMFGGGVSLRLGHGGNKAKEAQMKAAAAENKELRAKVDDLTARMDALLSVLNPNMSKDFPDVPENHWAYEAVSRLAGNGIVEGYEDGKYHGERQMTRYEMAEIIYNALSKGAKAEKKLVEEFRPELQAMAAQKKA